MSEKQCAIGIITNPVPKAGVTPLTNLARIINIYSSKTYLITGNYGKTICDTKNGHMIVSSRNYSTKNNLLTKVSTHILLQLFTSVKILQHKKNVSTWIFFLDAHSLLLPVITAKISMKKIIFIPTASIKKAAEAKKSILLHFLSYSEMLTNRFADRIVLYSNCLTSEWDMDMHIQKLDIASEHIINLNTFTVITRIQDREKLIGYIGRFSEVKGVLNFTKALPTILSNQQDLRVLIAGDGQLKEVIRTSLQEKKVSNRIDLCDWISHDDLPKYLNKLRLLIIPSYSEGLPNIMLEAMACGTPVLATPVGAVPDVIIDGKTGFIMEDNSIRCITESVIRALDSPELESIAENGRQFVAENFAFEHVIARWKEVLDVI